MCSILDVKARVRSNHEILFEELTLDYEDMAALDGLNRSDGTGTWGLMSPYAIL